MTQAVSLTDAEAARLYGQVRRLPGGCHGFGVGGAVSRDPEVFFRGRMRQVKRLLYAATGRTIPEGKQLRSCCRTKGCVALAHLVVVSRGRVTLPRLALATG